MHHTHIYIISSCVDNNNNNKYAYALRGPFSSPTTRRLSTVVRPERNEFHVPATAAVGAQTWGYPFIYYITRVYNVYYTHNVIISVATRNVHDYSIYTPFLRPYCLPPLGGGSGVSGASCVRRTPI